MTHYHQERNHQALDNILIEPDNLLTDGRICRRQRLGGGTTQNQLTNQQYRMKNSIILLFLAVALLTSYGGNVITLTGNTAYIVKSNEVAEIIATVDPTTGSGAASFYLNGNQVFLNKALTTGEINIVAPLPLVIAGPNTIQKYSSGSSAGALTIRVRTKDEYLASFSAPTVLSSSAVVIPEDAAGPVSIVLESSTDLVTWVAANPGTYGSSTSRRFFRVRAVQN